MILYRDCSERNFTYTTRHRGRFTGENLIQRRVLLPIRYHSVAEKVTRCTYVWTYTLFGTKLSTETISFLEVILPSGSGKKKTKVHLYTYCVCVYTSDARYYTRGVRDDLAYTQTPGPSINLSCNDLRRSCGRYSYACTCGTMSFDNNS